jgi:hypothetical protein
MIQIKVAYRRLSELAKNELVLRCQHLLDLQKAADDRGDSVCSGIILEILTWEQEPKKWRRINNTTRPPQGGNPLMVCVQSGPVIETYDTEDEVVRHTSNHLSKCFHIAYSASCYCRKLFDDLGFTGDTECAQQILEGTYDFPPTDIWTKKILQEAHYTFSHMSGAEIMIIVTMEDFQNFWRRVDERTSSSFSRVTFSHYKAAASNPMLSAMHTTYLTACACRGLPLV